MNTVRNAVAKFSTLALQQARRAIEAEQIAAALAGVSATQSHVGQLEMLQAIGDELDERRALIPAPAYVEVNREDGIRYSRSFRVF